MLLVCDVPAVNDWSRARGTPRREVKDIIAATTLGLHVHRPETRITDRRVGRTAIPANTRRGWLWLSRVQHHRPWSDSPRWDWLRASVDEAGHRCTSAAVSVVVTRSVTVGATYRASVRELERTVSTTTQFRCEFSTCLASGWCRQSNTHARKHTQ